MEILKAIAQLAFTCIVELVLIDILGRIISWSFGMVWNPKYAVGIGACLFSVYFVKAQLFKIQN
jgi:hypothetical protein